MKRSESLFQMTPYFCNLRYFGAAKDLPGVRELFQQERKLHPNKFYNFSKIPLPFPNSSYLLEPSRPMANAEM